MHIASVVILCAKDTPPYIKPHPTWRLSRVPSCNRLQLLPLLPHGGAAREILSVASRPPMAQQCLPVTSRSKQSPINGHCAAHADSYRMHSHCAAAGLPRPERKTFVRAGT